MLLTQSRQTGHPSKRKGSGFEPEVVKLPQGYAIEAAKIPLSGSVAGFAGDHRRGADKARYFD